MVIIVIAALGTGGACAGGILALINHPPPPAAIVVFAVFVALALWIHRWTMTDDDEPADIHDVVCEHCCGWIADGDGDEPACCDAAGSEGSEGDDATATRC